MWVVRLLAGGNKRPIGNARFVARMGTDAAAPVIRGTTSANGTLALPVFDDVETITLRVDAFRALFGSLPRAGAPKEPDLPEPADVATDPDVFPDEGNFVALTLDAGALARIQLPVGAEPPVDPNAPPVPPDFDSVDAPPLTIAERDLGVGRRLANLGSGRKELETDPVARRAAVAAFQRSFRTAANAHGSHRRRDGAPACSHLRGHGDGGDAAMTSPVIPTPDPAAIPAAIRLRPFRRINIPNSHQPPVQANSNLTPLTGRGYDCGCRATTDYDGKIGQDIGDEVARFVKILTGLIVVDRVLDVVGKLLGKIPIIGPAIQKGFDDLID